MRQIAFVLSLSALLFLASVACAEEATSLFNLDEEPISPVIPPAGLDPDKVRLGEKLFNDPRLSSDNSIACSSCHAADQGGTIRQPHSPPGVSGKQVPLNVPTILGTGLNFAQFWNGRAATLEDQVDGPLHGADEMASDWPTVVARLRKDPGYAAEFKELYGVSPNEKSVKDAIAAFERSQLPAGSPFDRYLMGDSAAVSPLAKQGYGMFKDLGCAACHQGQNVGGNMFQKFGIIRDYFEERGHISEGDYGRFNITRKEEDRYVFKIPSLRNVELTAPYFHDGSAKTLEEAVDIMAKYQLGHDLSAHERVALVEFLKSLTGKIPELPR